MFNVVQFLDEQKSVSVVPQSWYSNGATYWPLYKSDEKINKAARLAEQPSQHWAKHDVRVLKTCGKYFFLFSIYNPSFVKYNIKASIYNELSHFESISLHNITILK